VHALAGEERLSYKIRKLSAGVPLLTFWTTFGDTKVIRRAWRASNDELLFPLNYGEHGEHSTSAMAWRACTTTNGTVMSLDEGEGGGSGVSHRVANGQRSAWLRHESAHLGPAVCGRVSEGA